MYLVAGTIPRLQPHIEGVLWITVSAEVGTGPRAGTGPELFCPVGLDESTGINNGCLRNHFRQATVRGVDVFERVVEEPVIGVAGSAGT